MERRRRSPPGPRGMAILGSGPALRRDPLGFLQRLAREFGDVAMFRIGRRTVYQFNHPDLIRNVLVTQNRCFQKTGLVLQARPILGNGLLTSEGDFHTRQRRMIQPHLNPRQVALYGGVIAKYAAELCESWSDGQQIDLFQEMLAVTLRIVLGSLFEFDADQEIHEIERATTIAIQHFNRLLSPTTSVFRRLPSPWNRRYERAERFLNAFVFRMIAERQSSGRFGNDLLSKLLQTQDTDGDGSGMDAQQVRDELLTLLTAGHETIATALTWTWYLLSQHPEAEANLHDELDTVLSGRPPDASDVPRLPYTRMVLTEAMRLYPPLWALSRKTVTECVVGDYVVPVGTIVGVSQYVTHRDPRFYERQDEFDPRRWEASQAQARPKYAYFPFGGGPRLCIGEHFAWMEGILLLATIAQHWRPIIPAGYKVAMQPFITLRPRGGIPAVMERWKSTRSRVAAQLTGAT